MSIAFVAGQNDGTIYASGSTYTTEASTTSTDRRVLLISLNASGTITTPSGWTLVGDVSTSSTTASLFTKTAGSVGTETLTLTSSAGSLFVASATFTQAPLGTVGTVATGTSTSMAATAITPVGAADMLIFAGHLDNGGATITPPAGETTVVSGVARRNYLAYELLTSGVSTGTKTATSSVSAAWGALLVTLASPNNSQNQMLV